MNHNHKIDNQKEILTSWIKIKDYTKSHIIGAVMVILIISWIFFSWLTLYLEKPFDNGNIKNFTDALWWGFVTLTTVGYGDHYPVTFLGRISSVLLMSSGIIAVAIVTAKISSMLLEHVLLEGRHLVDKSKLKNHIVICGWREDMKEILIQILAHNKNLSSEQIVIIGNLSESMEEDIRSHHKLENIKVIVGDYFQTSTLERSVPNKARKVIILADRAPGPGGQIPSTMEADSRTVMTAISLSSIAKNTLITAEIIDPSMDNYLKMAGVTEIIYSGQFGRQLLVLGSAKTGAGIPNIIHELLDPNKSAQIKTIPIHPTKIGASYKEFKSYYELKHKGLSVIGLLENTGNRHMMKEFAVREAQKTADVHKLINNLKEVKDLNFNKPVFNPDLEYKIKRGSAAIIISNGLEGIEHDEKNIAA